MQRAKGSRAEGKTSVTEGTSLLATSVGAKGDCSRCSASKPIHKAIATNPTPFTSAASTSSQWFPDADLLDPRFPAIQLARSAKTKAKQ